MTKYIKDTVLIRDFKKNNLPMKVTKNGKDYDKYIEIADFMEKYNEEKMKSIIETSIKLFKII